MKQYLGIALRLAGIVVLYTTLVLIGPITPPFSSTTWVMYSSGVIVIGAMLHELSESVREFYLEPEPAEMKI